MKDDIKRGMGLYVDYIAFGYLIDTPKLGFINTKVFKGLSSVFFCFISDYIVVLSVIKDIKE